MKKLAIPALLTLLVTCLCLASCKRQENANTDTAVTETAMTSTAVMHPKIPKTRPSFPDSFPQITRHIPSPSQSDLSWLAIV